MVASGRDVAERGRALQGEPLAAAPCRAGNPDLGGLDEFDAR